MLIPESEDTFEVTPEEKAKLLAAIRELECGEVEDGWKFLRSMPAEMSKSRNAR